jgi:hypothetical protein
MKLLNKIMLGVLTSWKRNKIKAVQISGLNGVGAPHSLLILFCILTFLPSSASLAQIVYVGNSLTNGQVDGDPPLVILGEYSPSGPSSNSTATLPAGVVEDIRFYGSATNSFTLYALAWVGNNPSANEQSFQVVASESFINSNAMAGLQTNVVTDFQVNAGDFLAFWGEGPCYVASSNGLDATYASPGAATPYTATNPVDLGTNFTVGMNGDTNATYEYIPSGLTLPSRTYSIGADVLSTNGYTFIQIAGQNGKNGYLDGFGTNTLFNNAEGTAVASNFDIFVADTTNNRIRKVSTLITNWLVTTIAGSNGLGHADGVGTNAQFNGPQGIAVTSHETVFVSDTVNDTIRMLTLTNNNNWAVSTIAGVAGTTGTNNGTNVAGYFAKFDGPEGIVVDIHTNVFAADTTNDTIREITLTNGNWVVTTIAGLAGIAGSFDGTNSGARFDLPGGIAVDAADNVYVADSGNNEIRKVTPQGPNWVVTTIAGTNNFSGSTDGTGLSARFDHPGGIAVDFFDDLFVTDTSNNTVRAVVPWNGNWIVNTIGGIAGTEGYASGTGPAARFTNPRGISVNALGDLYLDEVTIYGGISPSAMPNNTPPSTVNYTCQFALSPASVDSEGAEWQLSTAGQGNWVQGTPSIPAAKTQLTTVNPFTVLFGSVSGWAPPSGTLSLQPQPTVPGAALVQGNLWYRSGCRLIVTNWWHGLTNFSLWATGTVGQTYSLQSNSMNINNDSDWYLFTPSVTFKFANAGINYITNWPPSPITDGNSNVFYRAISQEQ